MADSTLSMAPTKAIAHRDWMWHRLRATIRPVNAKWSTILPLLSVAAAAFVGVACGDDRDSARPMTEGERVALDSGCTACHGSNGEGGVGPAWKGLYQSEVRLSDGSTVIADEAYLTESIKEPGVQQVNGYGAMPLNSLNDAEVQAVVDFIKSLQA